ncbi:MAG TPA: hypothetical protein VM577_14800 [Anaerovoracaceae bacterium]|nr:hypothetical protein [Anaerovoracaceae bacterium]
MVCLVCGVKNFSSWLKPTKKMATSNATNVDKIHIDNGEKDD